MLCVYVVEGLKLQQHRSVNEEPKNLVSFFSLLRIFSVGFERTANIKRGQRSEQGVMEALHEDEVVAGPSHASTQAESAQNGDHQLQDAINQMEVALRSPSTVILSASCVQEKRQVGGYSKLCNCAAQNCPSDLPILQLAEDDTTMDAFYRNYTKLTVSQFKDLRTYLPDDKSIWITRLFTFLVKLRKTLSDADIGFLCRHSRSTAKSWKQSVNIELMKSFVPSNLGFHTLTRETALSRVT
uniref:Uncharacterized protein n=1 Tax=Tetranychus urticae TaxID=32264 RepID=T1K0I8_TETUR